MHTCMFSNTEDTHTYHMPIYVWNDKAKTKLHYEWKKYDELWRFSLISICQTRNFSFFTPRLKSEVIERRVAVAKVGVNSYRLAQGES